MRFLVLIVVGMGNGIKKGVGAPAQPPNRYLTPGKTPRHPARIRTKNFRNFLSLGLKPSIDSGILVYRVRTF